jgi:hypothetical protein
MKKSQKQARKSLSVTTEVVRDLTVKQLSSVGGGAWTITMPRPRPCDYSPCVATPDSGQGF